MTEYVECEIEVLVDSTGEWATGKDIDDVSENWTDSTTSMNRFTIKVRLPIPEDVELDAGQVEPGQKGDVTLTVV